MKRPQITQMKPINIYLPLILSCMVGVNVSAHDIEVPNADGVTIYYHYINNDTELAVTFAGDWYGYVNNEYSGAVVIPEEVILEERTLKVTRIENSTFSDCHELTSVTIPNSVTSIGNHTFNECRSLTSVNVPDGVTSIGDFTFDGCSSLTQVTIPYAVTTIGECAFDGCSALTSISIPSGVTNIGTSAFAHCYGFTSVDIPNSVTNIEDYTFAGCNNLTSVTIGNSVAGIGNNAFAGCRCLSSVTIPNNVTNIGDYAFSGCSGLSSIDIGNGVTSIGNDAFWECTSLSSVTMGNSVTSIGDFAFYGCSSLKSITIPQSVTHIGSNVFFNCNDLNAVHISDLEAWCNIQFDGTFFGYYHLYLNGKEITNLTIPEGVTSVSNYAFAKCYRLISITIPDGVTTIGGQAFAWCSNLRNIYCHAEQIPETGNNVFGSSNYDATLHVPAASVSAYQAVEPWKNFKEIVALPIEEIAYLPMIEEGKVWKVGDITSGNPAQCVEYFYFDGDTIIDGRTWKQMMCQRYVSPDFHSQRPSLNYVGAWYEEDRKVYFCDATNNQFKLMYDFSLNGNDTLQINNYLYVIGPRQIGGINGFKGIYRKVRQWENGENIYSVPWLEGVGGTDRPSTNVYSGYVDPLWALMSCTVGDEIIYLNDAWEDGATPGGIKDRKRFDFTHTIKTQPKMPRKWMGVRASSPAETEQSLYGEYNNQQLSINLDPLDEAYTVRIIDETGKVVYEKNINAGSIVGLSIDISALTEGRYTVTVENIHESFTGVFEALTTGISDALRLNDKGKMINDNGEMINDIIYNLQGQRLNSLQKGLNIVNGKKVYVK